MSLRNYMKRNRTKKRRDPPFRIDTKEVNRKPEISKEFIAVLNDRLSLCGKRRATFTYLFATLGAFFILCDYFNVTTLKFLGSEFTLAPGHLYFAAVAVLSVISLYMLFFLFHEVNVKWVLEASYHAIGLPKTFQKDSVLNLFLYPSPISYSLLASANEKSLRFINLLVEIIVAILNLLCPLALIIYFGYKGVKHLGFSPMLAPFIIAATAALIVVRAMLYSGGAYIKIEEYRDV